MGIEEICINGRRYVSHDSWTFGDYGGYGSAGLANIRELLSEAGDKVVSCSAGDLEHIKEGCPYGLGASILDSIKQEQPWAIHTTGSYGHEQVWVRKPLDHIRGWSKRCENYPLLNEELSSEIEIEWENEARESWIRDDLIRGIRNEARVDEARDMKSSEAGKERLWEAYRAAMEAENEYPVAEYSGVHVDVERIQKAFERALFA
jgi:hypothetical protein